MELVTRSVRIFGAMGHEKAPYKQVVYTGLLVIGAPSWARTRDPLINSQML